MKSFEWTDERCAQLENLQRVLRTVADANSSNNFLVKMTEASEIAQQLLGGPFPAFVSFLQGIAIHERTKKLLAEDGMDS